MNNYLNQSIYTCKDPRLLITDIATTPEQYYVTRLKKDSTSERVLRYKSYKRTPIVIRCGKCQGCRKLTNDQWYLRLYHHYLSQPDSKMIFVTLTFNEAEYRYIMDYVTDMPKDEYSGTDFTPVYRKYIVPLKKRLRAERGENLEFDFFCVSELGDDNQRFHFHICLFWRNWRFFLNAATRWNKFHPYSKHYVKTKAGLRLQSDLEAYLQHKIERQWSNERYSNLENRYIFERHGKSRRISATGSIGNVTLFEADGVGMLKYVTSYALKCQHDGVTTYHRQTPALGKKYVADNLAQAVFDNNIHVGYCGSVKGKRLYIPLPRVYFRWFGDKAKMIDNFWQQLPLQLQRFVSLTHSDSLWQYFDDSMDISDEFDSESVGS